MKLAKKSLGILVGIGALLGATTASANVCLQQASNADLVSELSRRLYVGGGGGGFGAQATYTCDLYGDLRVGLIGISGAEAKADVTVRNVQNCTRQTTLLSQTRSRISQVTLIGVCDLYGDMQRFSLTPDGTVRRLSEVTIRNFDTCMRQAEALNRP